MVVTYIFDYKIHKFTELNEVFFLCGFLKLFVFNNVWPLIIIFPYVCSSFSSEESAL